jgi:Tol biopolymer transport system component
VPDGPGDDSDGVVHVRVLATGQEAVVRDAPGAADPAWSPTEDQLVLTTASSGRGRVLRRVHVVVEDGKPRFDDPRDLASGSVRRPTWSPDGTRIAYRGGRRLYVVDSDGGNPVTVLVGLAGGASPVWATR